MTTRIDVWLERDGFTTDHNIISSASHRGPFTCLSVHQDDNQLALFIRDVTLLSDLADQVLAALRDLEAAWAPTVRAIEAAFVLPAGVRV